MKLNGYDLLMTIRRAGAKPKYIALHLYPVKRLPCAGDFIDVDFSTIDETSELAEYELDGLRGLDVCLVGKRKDDRLRNACKSLIPLVSALIVTSGDHSGLNIWQNGVWS